MVKLTVREWGLVFFIPQSEATRFNNHLNELIGKAKTTGEWSWDFTSNLILIFDIRDKMLGLIESSEAYWKSVEHVGDMFHALIASTPQWALADALAKEFKLPEGMASVIYSGDPEKLSDYSLITKRQLQFYNDADFGQH